MVIRDRGKTNQSSSEEPSVWSTGLLFATLILLTALMFVLTKKIFATDASPVDVANEIRAEK